MADEAFEQRPLEEQVLVITGGSSGIGLATARLAAKRGARVVLVSRSRANLRRAVKSIRKRGGEATYVVADVGDPKEVEAVAAHAVKTFGGIDTWVNNAAVSIYGRLEDIALEDARRLFETNYWGMVHGSLVAAEHLRERGGTLINVGSVVSDVAIPLQGHYAASKHAVKGFTNALRLELERDGAPIQVTLVKPASIDTPFPRHARNYLPVEPTLPPPVYSPRVVARAILHCATHPKREILVGGGGRMMTAMKAAAPRLFDRYMEKVVARQQLTHEPTRRPRKDSLHRAHRSGEEERGDYDGHVMRSSAYTAAKLHPLQTVAAMVLLGAGVAMAFLRRPPERIADLSDL